MGTRKVSDERRQKPHNEAKDFMNNKNVVTEKRSAGSPHPIVRCIDDTIAVLVSRLEAKQPMYNPDAEWNAIMQTCEALRAAKRDIERYVSPNDPSSATAATKPPD